MKKITTIDEFMEWDRAVVGQLYLVRFLHGPRPIVDYCYVSGGSATGGVMAYLGIELKPVVEPIERFYARLEDEDIVVYPMFVLTDLENVAKVLEQIEKL